MSKTETQSEALSAERRLYITAVANLELRKKFGDEGFRLDLDRDELEALIEMADRVSRLDAEVRELKMTVQHESLCVEAAKERIEALDAENKALRERLEATAAPAGWKLVPEKPTDAMLGAAQKAWLADPLRRSSTLYAAALAAAPQAPAMDATAERDAAFEAVRQRLCKLPKYSFILADGDGGAVGVARRKDGSGRWIEFQAAHELFDPLAVDAALAPQAAAKNGGAA